MMGKSSVLFICNNNSGRSQMAEGLLNAMYGVNYEAFSAGVNPTSVNSYAIEVMKEIGIDLSKQYSKSINHFKDNKFDYVVTVCDNAKETCPFFPGKKTLHRNFKDPAESLANRSTDLDRRPFPSQRQPGANRDNSSRHFPENCLPPAHT